MIEIKHRDGRVLFVAEHAQDVRAALVQAANGGADLRGAYLGGAYLGGADLRGAYLGGANLGDAYLGGADLRGAYLGGANLRGANLRDANLGDAYLRGANLGDANLRDANLRGANLRDAKGLNPRRVNDLLILREQVGKIRAYKLVRADGQGPYSGGITYEVGGTYEVTDANTDDMVECGVGINLATLPWCCREWQPGRRILVAEFTGRDIAAIPTGGGGKFRVSRCRIVRELDLAEIGLVGEAT